MYSLLLLPSVGGTVGGLCSLVGCVGDFSIWSKGGFLLLGMQIVHKLIVGQPAATRMCWHNRLPKWDIGFFANVSIRLLCAS